MPMECTTRTLTEAERRITEPMPQRRGRDVVRYFGWSIVWLVVLAAAVGGFILMIAKRGEPGTALDFAILIGVALLAFVTGSAGLYGTIVCASCAMRGLRQLLDRQPATQELQNVPFQVMSVSADRVATIMAFEDEGDIHFFDVGAGETLILRGQEAEPINGGPWPARQFRVLRRAAAAQDRVVCWVISSGPGLTAVRRRQVDSGDVHLWDGPTVEIVSLPWESVVAAARIDG